MTEDLISWVSALADGAELERRQPVAVQCDVGVGRAGREILAHHEDSLAVRHHAGAEEAHVGGKRHIPEIRLQAK